MNVKELVNYIKNAFNAFVVPFLKTANEKVDLYYISLGIFAFAIAAGAISLLLRLSFKKVRNSTCGKLLTFFALCFALDLFVCLVEHEFSAKYFTTLLDVYVFCFMKFVIGVVFYLIVEFETIILRRRDKKAEQKKQKSLYKNGKFGQRASNVNAEYESAPFALQYGGEFAAAPRYENPYLKENSLNKPYATVSEKPAEPLDLYDFTANKQGEKPRSIEILERVNLKRACENGYVQPDVNIGYVRALCESLKKQTISESDREKIADLELSLKMNDLTTPEKVQLLNESLRWLIKKIADCGAQIN